ncbi:hypothetical protein [Gemmobacter serpentinus]|uniref:hypothetical protein n=1 Tax=Gemmobacter serpentinus TaxID=2652247 RepID=UPI00124C59D5|nr:hypothetical protein [Gemmobacter serpentinus]
MTELAELERRIVAALGRIDAGLDRWQDLRRQAAAVPAAAEAVPEEEVGADAEAFDTGLAVDLAAAQATIARLEGELEAERRSNTQLTDRVRSLKQRESRNEAGLEARIEQLTKQLDVQGLELHRLRKGTIQLREALRVLREASEAGTIDAAMINKALLAELEALRAARSSETVELEEIIAELTTLIGKEAEDA